MRLDYWSSITTRRACRSPWCFRCWPSRPRWLKIASSSIGLPSFHRYTPFAAEMQGKAASADGTLLSTSNFTTSASKTGLEIPAENYQDLGLTISFFERGALRPDMNSVAHSSDEQASPETPVSGIEKRQNRSFEGRQRNGIRAAGKLGIQKLRPMGGLVIQFPAGFIRDFVLHWSAPISEQDVERLDLRDASVFSSFCPRHYYGGPVSFDVDDCNEVLVFRDENQGAAACWGILLSDIANGDSDPPVYVKQDMADKKTENWERWAERFSLACVYHAVGRSA
ncbi:hypothetical protein P175DRAFT_0530347 [Aspergillus ochraceoroseus IBT 24754]|uniref:Uncharacterized protein n=1 Tax=Aspergillus ochraceoroseus IBT 24754 TaxID=1392256 RepID=A0A2T5M3X6_9EURO|nr:uncharacterized protein P175DRAFT_0530347 [Aspergillus ochraceoroseus IBT 24754]PTU23241.1 hypothetical protein P175DRAFT_0530347 [Aspergillus ochraceoroseus IBT 24754]